MIELIVVLGIFAVMSTVVIYNYGSFESSVDITNLANDVALQVVTAQKAAISGLIPIQNTSPSVPPWKPSYGVYFSSNTTLGADLGADNKDFVYFVDLNQDNKFDGSSCPSTLTQECLSKYTITKNDYISRLDAFYTDGTDTTGITTPGLKNITITFERPNSGAVINIFPTSGKIISYVQITVVDQTGKIPAHIDLYSSGRVQIN